MNVVFFLLAAAGLAGAAWQTLGNGDPQAMAGLTGAALAAAQGAVPLALGLVGAMALFLGLMKVAEDCGALTWVAGALAPLVRRLFPEVPADHPAMAAMIMNMAANLLGLGNAATPLGIRAMEQLQRLNPHPSQASDAQVRFLALNTASVTLLPTSVIALRAASGSANPAAVVVPSLVATLASAAIAVAAARLLAPLAPIRPEPLAPIRPEPPSEVPDAGNDAAAPPSPAPPPAAPRRPWLALALVAALVAAGLAGGQELGHWLVPGLIVVVLGAGLARGVRIYDSFVTGAAEAFTIATRIIPYLIAILVVIAMARQSGALPALLTPLAALTTPLGVPAEALLMALMRSLSGSGSFGLLAADMRDPAIGPDSPLGLLLGTIYGSSETTFYVLAVYFGAVGLRRTRHALAAGLIADLAGLIAATLICALLSA